MDNKKISLLAGGAMILSLFLPFMDAGPLGSASLFDAIRLKTTFEGVALFALVIGFLVLTLMDKLDIARICAILVVIMVVYSIYQVTSQIPSSVNIDLTRILGIGAYLLPIGAIAGVIFAKSSD